MSTAFTVDQASDAAGPSVVAEFDLDSRLSALLPQRVNTNAATVEKDLAKLVLTLVDVMRRLLEKQAIRRVNAGSLSEDEIERMGETFLKLDRRMTELKTAFGLEGEDLNLSLGPIRDLL